MTTCVNLKHTDLQMYMLSTDFSHVVSQILFKVCNIYCVIKMIVAKMSTLPQLI